MPVKCHMVIIIVRHKALPAESVTFVMVFMFFVLIGNSLIVESVSLSGRVFVPRTKSKATGFLDW